MENFFFLNENYRILDRCMANSIEDAEKIFINRQLDAKDNVMSEADWLVEQQLIEYENSMY